MNQENNYYNPTIEEFYVGFEYEKKQGFTDGTVKTIEEYNEALWENKVVDVGDIPYINLALNGKNSEKGLFGIRVKYLDKEDIESLDWSFISSTQNHIVFIKQTLTYLQVSDNKLEMFTNNEKVFKGFVKNKSELKVLMKQLNII